MPATTAVTVNELLSTVPEDVDETPKLVATAAENYSSPEQVLSEQPVLLLSAMVLAQNPTDATCQKTVLLFMDSGSQRSFVTEDLVRRLKLDCSHTEPLSITSFGSTSPKVCQSFPVQVAIRKTDGNFAKLKANTVPVIMQKTSTVHFPQSVLSTTDTRKFQCRRSGILIGADRFFDFI